MNGLKQKEEEIGLIDLDENSDEKREADAQQEEGQVKSERNARNVKMALAVILAGSILLIALGTFLLKVPLITTGFVIVIEAVVAAALNNSKLWIHVGIMAIQIALGIWSGHALFLVFAAAYYFVLVIALKLLELDG